MAWTGAVSVGFASFHFFYPIIAVLSVWPVFSTVLADEPVREAAFAIKSFEVFGNSIFPADRIEGTTNPFIGTDRTAADVEKARDALEKLYHDAGYPAVLVNIPEQTVKDGMVRLQVIESRIGQVRVSGNRYYTREKVMADLPSFTPGKVLYLPQVQQEIGRVNANRDIKVEPAMILGKEAGTIDVALKVEDRLPLHGYVELNNRASHDTSELRANAMIRYDNLWQKDHSLALQYQTSPQNGKEVEMVSGSYVLPAPWEKDRQMAFYGIWSDSDRAFGEGFRMIGKGKILGMRYVVPLAPYKLYVHNVTLGLDYKDFKEVLGFAADTGTATHTPVTYLPLNFSYSASFQDAWGGTTQFSAGLNLSFRGLVADQREFENKRYKGMANYLFATAGIQRNQKLPWGMGLFAKIDGQLADQPLIANEQYVAGGMESVRGYKEVESAGDDAIHGTLELSFPDPLDRLGIGKKVQMSPFVFCEAAKLTVKDPLPGQDRSSKLEGIGAGVRGTITKYLEFELDWAMALAETSRIPQNGSRFYFKLKAVF